MISFIYASRFHTGGIGYDGAESFSLRTQFIIYAAYET